MINNSQLLIEVKHKKPEENLLESIPVKDGIKPSKIEPMQSNLSRISWKEILGLSWIIYENESELD